MLIIFIISLNSVTLSINLYGSDEQHSWRFKMEKRQLRIWKTNFFGTNGVKLGFESIFWAVPRRPYFHNNVEQEALFNDSAPEPGTVGLSVIGFLLRRDLLPRRILCRPIFLFLYINRILRRHAKSLHDRIFNQRNDERHICRTFDR